MFFPRKLVKIVRKTHKVPSAPSTKEKLEDLQQVEVPVVFVKDVVNSEACENKETNKEKPQPSSSEPKPVNQSPIQSGGLLPKPAENTEESSNLPTGKLRLTDNYVKSVYKRIKDENKEKMDNIPNTTRPSWRQRKEATRELVEILRNSPNCKNMRENQVIDLGTKVYHEFKDDPDFTEEELAYLMYTDGDMKLTATTEGNFSEKELNTPEWQAAIKKELIAHTHVFRPATQQEIYEYCTVRNQKLIPCMMLLSVKRDGRRKARIVCLGYLAPDDPISTYAGVTDINIIKMLISISITNEGIDLFSADATSAFLQADYPGSNPVLISLDRRLQTELGYKVGRIIRCMNGLKHSPIGWSIHRDKKLLHHGWSPSETERCLWHKQHACLCVFVDNFFFFGRKEDIEIYYNELREELKLVPENPIETESTRTFDILGIDLIYSKKEKKAVLSQSRYVNKLIQRFGGHDGKVPNSPMLQNDAEDLLNIAVSEEEKLKWSKAKLEIQGSLQYLAQTRYDIIVPLKVISKAKATEKVVIAAKKIIRYLRQPKCLAFRANRNRNKNYTTIEVYTDGDWASLPDRHSLSGVVVCVNGNNITGKCVTQHTVAVSTSEAEIYGMSEGCKSGLYSLYVIQEIVNILRLPPLKMPVPLIGDNSGAIKHCSQPSVQSRSKHISIRDAMIKSHTERGIFELTKCNTTKNNANGLTKIQSGKPFSDSCGQLQIENVD